MGDAYPHMDMTKELTANFGRSLFVGGGMRVFHASTPITDAIDQVIVVAAPAANGIKFFTNVSGGSVQAGAMVLRRQAIKA